MLKSQKANKISPECAAELKALGVLKQVEDYLKNGRFIDINAQSTIDPSRKIKDDRANSWLGVLGGISSLNGNLINTKKIQQPTLSQFKEPKQEAIEFIRRTEVIVA